MKLHPRHPSCLQEHLISSQNIALNNDSSCSPTYCHRQQSRARLCTNTHHTPCWNNDLRLGTSVTKTLSTHSSASPHNIKNSLTPSATAPQSSSPSQHTGPWCSLLQRSDSAKTPPRLHDSYNAHPISNKPTATHVGTPDTSSSSAPRRRG